MAFERLVRWIEEAGGKVAPLALEHDAERGRRLRAAGHIPAAATVLRVPQRCLLTAEAARSSRIGQEIAASSIEPESDHVWLVAYLLEERFAASSPFRPYLDLLPESYPHMPLHWGDRELSLLRGSFTLERILKSKQLFPEHYERFAGGVPAIRGFGYEAFLWAALTVNTRAFGWAFARDTTLALVPVADLLNHKEPGDTRWGYNSSGDGFLMTALQAFAPGDEVHDSYGPKCNGSLFLGYGFALPENDNTEARITFETSGGPRTFAVPASYAAAKTREMFAFLRHACAGHVAGGTQRPLDARNEEAVLRILAAACEQALGGFDTTLAEDDALLASPLTAGNARSAILMRRSEKRVLHHFIALAAAALPLFSLSREQARRAAEEPSAGDERFSDYLRGVVLRLVRRARPA